MLGKQGAENLNGKGDAYINWSDSDKLVRVRGIQVSDKETSSIIDSIVDKYPDKKYYNRVKF